MKFLTDFWELITTIDYIDCMKQLIREEKQLRAQQEYDSRYGGDE